MTEPTADVPTAPERDDLTAAPRESSEPTDQSGQAGTSGQAEQVDGGPAPAIIVLTEEALKPVDVDKIIALHQDEAPTYRVLVPADTDRNLLSSFLDHLSLFEMREALDALKPVDRDEAHADASTALSESLAEFQRHNVVVAGETLGVPVLHMYAGDWRLG